jgi:predicted AlkP superfamily phosphohydrolase/phosphomutase
MFKRLIETGVATPLKSTILPVTPPAWTSLITGTNPGKHGQFYFHDLKALPDQFILCNSTHRKVSAIWNVLTEAGKTCVIQNLPMTYPPEEINGAMITGFLTPQGATDNTHPPHLHSELKNMGYRIGPIFGRNEKPTIDDIEFTIQQRTKAACWLMDKYDWDLFLVVYMATDGVVHKYPKQPEIIKKVYQFIDKALEQLTEAVPENTIIILVSDHGTGVLYRNFFINNWLFNNEFLQIRKPTQQTSGKHSLLSKLLRRLGGFRPIRYILHKLPVNYRRQVLSQIVPKRTDINRKDSMAWCPATTRNFAFIDINPPKEENPHHFEKVAERIISALKSATDPQSGEYLVRDVHKTENILWGPETSLAPPLILETDSECNISYEFTYDRREFRSAKTNPVPTHTMRGIFFANGPGIQSQKTQNFEPKIWDIMPTILHILDVPPPNDLDGRLLKEIFLPRSEFAKRNQHKSTTYPIQKRRKKSLTTQEQEEVADRLRQLGYL